MQTIKLKVKAKTNWENDFQDNLPVELQKKNNEWILRIVGGASWYVSTILDGGFNQTIALDYGADYHCLNFGDIMGEAIAALTE